MKRHELKIKRLETSYLKIISEGLLSKIRRQDFDPNFITLTRVEIDRDIKVAEIYYSSTKDINIKKMTEILNSLGGFLFSEIKKKLKTGFLPKIYFIYDDKNESIQRVLEILNRGNKKDD